MSRKAENAARELVTSEEAVTAHYEGETDGLNRTQRTPLAGTILLTDSAIIVGWVKSSLLKESGVAERFERRDLLGVEESHEGLPGMKGALERKNATKALGRAMGNSSTRPTVTVQTRRGDFRLFFKPKELGEVRSCYVAITDLIGARP